MADAPVRYERTGAAALVTIDRIRQQIAENQVRVDASREYLRLTDLRYRGGVVSYLEVLDAQRQLFSAEIDLSDSQLTHLLAVSGQNVAFTLALAGPVLRRLRIWPRLGATLVVLALFGLATRFEPSVLRAAATRSHTTP